MHAVTGKCMDDDEMALPPMRDTRQRHLVTQCFEAYLYRKRIHADRLGRLRNAGERHSRARNRALFPQEVGVKNLSVMPGNHAQAGRPAVHIIQLAKGRESFHIKPDPHRHDAGRNHTGSKITPL